MDSRRRTPAECAADPRHGWRSVLPRFWKYANRQRDDDCWLWQGEVDAGGYGVMHLPSIEWEPSGRRRKRRMKAHRFSWEIHHAVVPKGSFVLHDCDVRYPPGDISYRKCVNPTHLRLGSTTDNNRDTTQKGRGGIGFTMALVPERRARGGRIGIAKLGDASVIRIIERLQQGEAQRVIASDYGVSQATISAIALDKIYRHLPRRGVSAATPSASSVDDSARR